MLTNVNISRIFIHVAINLHMKKHPNKEIQQAIDIAIENGWRFVKTGKSSHAFCRLYCSDGSRDGCVMSVWSTPRSTQNHANQILRVIEKCNHRKNDN